jgi:hypothetical protein
MTVQSAQGAGPASPETQTGTALATGKLREGSEECGWRGGGEAQVNPTEEKHKFLLTSCAYSISMPSVPLPDRRMQGLQNRRATYFSSRLGLSWMKLLGSAHSITNGISSGRVQSEAAVRFPLQRHLSERDSLCTAVDLPGNPLGPLPIDYRGYNRVFPELK